MIRFECDYAEGAHPKILERLLKTNLEQTPGYGLDGHCERARHLIRRACGDEGLDVHFLSGGTQANLTVIAAALRPHQGVLCAQSGHINVHETGAVEATGHKVLALKSADGRITAAQVEGAVREHWALGNHEHLAQPGMVYISQPTENGTIYSRGELEALHGVCQKYGLPLFVDGARLGYALASPKNDLALPDLARLCDVFYIGGTKVGALLGEAVVIANENIKKDFRYLIKQRGAMLAKGRALGIQFEVLFEDGLYEEIAAHAVGLALRLRRALEELGCGMYYDSPTNQQFPILPNDVIAALGENYSFEPWAAVDAGHTAIRLCTSWASQEAQVAALIGELRRLLCP